MSDQLTDPMLSPASMTATPQVILADDEPAIRALLQTALTRQGFELLTAADGRECMSLLASKPEHLSLAVFDISMPYYDGWECLKRLRKTYPDVPVLIMTGYDPKQVSLNELDAHTRMLRKPFSINQFLSEVDSLTPARR